MFGSGGRFILALRLVGPFAWKKKDSTRYLDSHPQTSIDH